MPYYEVANLVTVTKTNMIDKMPCPYGTLRVASGPIYILLTYPMNQFQRMVTVGHNPTVIVYKRIPTKPYDTTKPQSDGYMQRDVSYSCLARSSLPPGCLWRLWRSMSTLTEPFRPDGNVFRWLCRYCFCPQRLRISHQWMSATNQNLDYPRGKAENHWCSIDAHSQYGEVTCMLSLLSI